MRRRLLSVGAVTAVVTAVVTGVALAGTSHIAASTGDPGGGSDAMNLASATAGSGKAADVDGDGYDDLAVGAPDAATKGYAKAGYVALTYGTKNGIQVSRHKGLTQSTTGVPGTPEAGDRFGSALALGDMDGDGYADLVVGASGEAIGDVKGAGSVTVVFGSATGLSTKAIAFHAPTVTARQGFGGRLALGDYNHDGRKDLAVVDGTKVDVVLGAKNLRSTPTPKITRITPPGGGAGTGGISSGDINGDGYDDLVTVAYFDDPADEGTLGVLPGSRTGLKSTPLGRNVGLPFAGYKAVVGDINGDGKADVVIDTGFSDGPDDYLLRTFPGSASGLDAAGAVVWNGDPHQGTAARLADVNGDRHADLLIGDPNANDSDGFSNAGALTVVPGSANWLTASKAQTLSLDTKGVVGVAETGDLFGSAMAPGDYNGDGTADLAVGARGKWRGTGAVSMLYGGGDGLTGAGSILFGPDSFGYEAVKASFGAALSG
ncbi:integrin-like protein [Streptomyces bingchenggensis BCW-1]|uniref:Integrin-like protein n=1 Tax=Streptomyces bingchenggensis (strain BCW-1) TaxID=749414 RepID=D7C378_STRBB|nr:MULTISPECIES: FG-GAP-like repeat-containing protein [Streptomyces]ADI08140.1 integrin-like protein [Streptomyces bingchenggensis BCW-1]